MADKFMTDLDAANAVSGTDLFMVSQGSAIPKRAPVSFIKDALFATGTFTRNLLNAVDATAVKLLLGLNRVDNTNDLEKPLSTAATTALAGKAASSHTHVMAGVTGLTAAIAAKQDALPSLATNDGKVLTVSSGALAWLTPTGGGGGGGDMFKSDNLAGLANVVTARTNLGLGSAALSASTAFAAATHTHAMADVTGLTAALSAKLDTSGFTYAALPGKPTTFASDWSTLANKPATFAPSAHTHVISEVTGLQSALDAKAPLANPSFTGGETVTGNALATTNLAKSVFASHTANLGGGNTGLVEYRYTRTSPGTDWTSAAYEIGRYTDGTEQQIMRFNPASTGNFMVLRYNSATVVTFSLAGDITAAGNVTAYSDRRLKRDIVSLGGCLPKVLALRPVEFNWRRSDKRDTGLIAQEVEELFPEFVHTDPETDIKSVDYGRLVVPLIAAVQELSARVRELEARHGPA